MATNRNNEPDETPAPPKLVAALRRTQSARVFVPRTVDEEVLRAAQQKLAPVPTCRPRWLPNWLAQSAIIAACLALFVALTYPVTKRINERKQAHAQDLNRDGRVDILDALQLAQQIKSGVNSGATADFNHDGVVDLRDAEVIAAQAVKLEKGGRS